MYISVCLLACVCVCVCVCIVHVHCTCIHEYIECVCNRLFQASSLNKRIFSEKPKHMGRKKRKVIQNLTFILCPPLCAVQPRSMYILLVADPRSQWKRSPLINAHWYEDTKPQKCKKKLVYWQMALYYSVHRIGQVWNGSCYWSCMNGETKRPGMNRNSLVWMDSREWSLYMCEFLCISRSSAWFCTK